MKINFLKTNKKNNPKWFYFILGIIPILVIVLLEVILRSFQYGTDYSTFVKISDDYADYKFFNPKLPQKYFGNSPIIPSVIPDGFTKVKNKNTFRIFALGGSTTAGFPHPQNGSFPRLLKRLLLKEYPGVKFEVINLGISAVNSITIRDIIDDVIDEEPDLIIIYAGHNEYYGALGAASNISGFYNLFFTRLLLEFKEFRLVQLVENSLQFFISAVSEKSEDKGTLMSEMAGNKLIPIGAEEYTNGIEQFESNLSYILSECKNNNVPAMVGTLASNLLQEPLCKLSGCDSLTREFINETRVLDENSRQKLYNIKDMDGLRFRAPEKINEIIKDLTHKYDYNLFDVQNLFENFSDFGIIGENLMMDHLHPTYDGNLMIAKFLLKFVKESKIIDSFEKEKGDVIQRNIEKYKSYTKLDSSLAILRIEYLKNDFPFATTSQKKPIILSTYEDSLAFGIINRKYSWENAHIILAKKYLKMGDLENYTNEMNVLIEDKPFDKYSYLETIKSLERLKEKRILVDILIKYFEDHPNFETAKRLGEIFNSLNNYNAAFYFYNACLNYSQNDPEIYFHLSALYYKNKDLPNALENISKCLAISADYPNAQKIYYTLLKMYKQK